MDPRVLQVRVQLASARRRNPRQPQYPESLKAEVVRVAASLHAAGMSHTTVAKELDLNRMTLAHWESAFSNQHTGSASLLPVAIVPTSEPALHEEPTLVVHGPLGLRVEGLDMAGLVELLRRLA